MNDDIEKQFIEAARRSPIIANAIAAHHQCAMAENEALKTACVLLVEVNANLTESLRAARNGQPVIIHFGDVSLEL